MRSLFTVHAGEYLVGAEVERRFPDAEVWVPARDTGVDLLVTHGDRHVALQVKLSRIYAPRHGIPKLAHIRGRRGWWTFNPRKLRESRADLWVLVLFSTIAPERASYVILPPAELAQRLKRLRGRAKTWHTYVEVLGEQCWETRGLRKPEYERLASGGRGAPVRNFTEYLDAWHLVAKQIA